MTSTYPPGNLIDDMRLMGRAMHVSSFPDEAPCTARLHPWLVKHYKQASRTWWYHASDGSYLCKWLYSLWAMQVGFGDVWKQSLSELSGGQRSLLALSLILAMLLFKPAPIYILDEVCL